MLVQEKRSIYLAIKLSLREISHVLCAHALVRTLVSVTFVRDRMLPMHARVALWSTRPRASVESIEP